MTLGYETTGNGTLKLLNSSTGLTVGTGKYIKVGVSGMGLFEIHGGTQRFRKLGRRSVKRAWKEAGKTRFCAPAGYLSKFAFTADLFCCADMIYSSISVLMTVNPQEDAP